MTSNCKDKIGLNATLHMGKYSPAYTFVCIISIFHFDKLQYSHIGMYVYTSNIVMHIYKCFVLVFAGDQYTVGHQLFEQKLLEFLSMRIYWQKNWFCIFLIRTLYMYWVILAIQVFGVIL